MSNKNADLLFLLIKSLEKAEKRNFKLYVQRNSNNEDLKVVQLFDALDKMETYNESLLLKKNPALKKQQISNLKAHLLKLLLISLRLMEDKDNIMAQLREQLDFAQILYDKGFYLHSLRQLEKVKDLAEAHHQISFKIQAINQEKKIESSHITRSMENRAETLSRAAAQAHNQLQLINCLSSLALQLYGWFIKNGHATDEKEIFMLNAFFKTKLPIYQIREMQFYEKLYLYQAFSWYHFILQDLLNYYKYAQKWVDLFEHYPMMKTAETEQYLRGLHNLSSAQFNLMQFEKLIATIELLEKFSASELGNKNQSIQIQGFVYLNIAKINAHFLSGSFTEGLSLVAPIEEKLQQHKRLLDDHKILIFYYKIACLYFGSGNNEKAIDYLNKIIHKKVDLRMDLQCYARLLHLIAHYELGNDQLLKYLIMSVYRFMARMKNLSIVEEEIFEFIKKSFSLNPKNLQNAFKTLKQKLEKHKGNPLEGRSFMYLDIISWLESKINKVNVQDIIKAKFAEKEKLKI